MYDLSEIFYLLTMNCLNCCFLILLIIVVISETYGQKSIQSSLAVELLKTTVKSTRNTLVSVLPLQFSLCKLASIATGNARNELLKALDFTSDDRQIDKMIKSCYTKLRDVLQQLRDTDLNYVNKMYLNYTNDIKKIFLENSFASYGVHVDSVSYTYPKSAAAFINSGISSGTLRRVEDVVNASDINNLTSILLITAEYFKPTWEMQFDYSLTKPRKFRLLDNSFAEVPMMSKLDSFLFYDAKDYRVLTITLGNRGCSMTFVQPTFLKLGSVLNKIQTDPDLLNKARRMSKWTQTRLVLPRMKIKSHIDLTELLKQIGLKEIFSSKGTGLNAVLSPGANASNIFVSKVKQKLFMDVDEFGMIRVNRDWPLYRQKPQAAPDTLEFTLDRPFYFTVNLEFLEMDQEGPGQYFELFNGVYYRPE